MASGSYTLNTNIANQPIASTITRTADSASAIDPTIPVGNAGTLTTRTDDETGSLTLGEGHTITTGSTIDLYWSGGARYGITVGTVSGTTVPIGADDSGTGDNLPTAATAVVASTQVEFNAAIDGDELALISMVMSFTGSDTSSSRLSLIDSGDSEIHGVTLGGNSPRVWDITGGDNNDFTGNPIVGGVVSNGSSTSVGTLKISWLQDATP